LPPADISIVTRHPEGDEGWVRWRSPVDVIQTLHTREVAVRLREVEKRTQDGLYALGFVAYEAGEAFDSHFAVKAENPSLPLLWFALFKGPEPFHPIVAAPPARPSIQWNPAEAYSRYQASIRQIKKRIAAGETYQVNYTFPLVAAPSPDLNHLFFALYQAQPTPYALWIETPAFCIASVSPELFFRLDGDRIACSPMKGTARRHPHPPLDAAVGAALKRSVKNRAENVMIVDMVRNDLGRIAEPGSTQVDHLFRVTAWPTLWQMTSDISATTRAGLPEIFSALFPCASITGAPKIKTSEIIRDLESGARGLYTGAIGWCGPGRRAVFSVAIRTAVQDVVRRQTSYGIGSGIVWDSTARDEYRECLLKARILHTQRRRDFRLLETMRWDPEAGFVMLTGHLARLEQSAAYLGFSFDRPSIEWALRKKARRFPLKPQRVRLLLNRQGRVDIQKEALRAPGHYRDPANAPALTAAIDTKQQDATAASLYHKTTNRLIYLMARRRHPGVDDVLLVNERDELMEFTQGNLVIRQGKHWLTPPVASGLLPGVFREHVLSGKKIREAVLTRHDLRSASAVYFINSVRGWRKVRWSSPP
jgi:para-aminobenzoate synthetase/4-amino-4-deoxychorismate lyase